MKTVERFTLLSAKRADHITWYVFTRFAFFRCGFRQLGADSHTLLCNMSRCEAETRAPLLSLSKLACERGRVGEFQSTFYHFMKSTDSIRSRQQLILTASPFSKLLSRALPFDCGNVSTVTFDFRSLSRSFASTAECTAECTLNGGSYGHNAQRQQPVINVLPRQRHGGLISRHFENAGLLSFTVAPGTRLA